MIGYVIGWILWLYMGIKEKYIRIKAYNLLSRKVYIPLHNSGVLCERVSKTFFNHTNPHSPLPTLPLAYPLNKLLMISLLSIF